MERLQGEAVIRQVHESAGARYHKPPGGGASFRRPRLPGPDGWGKESRNPGSVGKDGSKCIHDFLGEGSECRGREAETWDHQRIFLLDLLDIH